MKNKSTIILIFLAILIFAILIVKKFSISSPKAIKKVENEGVKIVASIYPLYDWAKNIIGNVDDAEVRLLVKNGDMHSFQPSIQDISHIQDCDIFLYVGGESDLWVEDALKSIGKEKLKVINCMQVLKDNLKYENITEGMQNEGNEDEREYDEHIWLSLKNAKVILTSLLESLRSIDKKNTPAYQANYQKYYKELDELDKIYAQSIKNCKKDCVVIADRFPFMYLLDDYNVKYFPAFPGCSAEVKANFETIIFLANRVDEYSLNTILKLEDSPPDLPNAIRNNTRDKNQEILVLDSMQSSFDKRNKDDNYLNIMYKNLDVLEKALN